MQQDILNALKTRFEGVSDKILQRLADKLQKQPNQEGLGAEQLANQVTMQQLLEYYGDQRATEAQQTAVKNYEKKLQTNAEQQASSKTTTETSKPLTSQTSQDPAEVPQWAKSLVEQVKTLNQRFDAVEKEKQQRNRQEQIEELIKGLPRTMQQAYRRIQLGDLSDQDFNQLKEDVTQEAAQILQETGARSAVFSAPTQVGSKATQKTATDKETDAVVSALNM